MQIYYFVLICFVAVGSGIYIAQEECPPNEEYLLCGSACPFNCSNPDGPVACNDTCAEGCFCKSGYFRNDNGTCVSADECGGKGEICDINEEFLSCGTACPGTCLQPSPLICGLACSMGCFCKSGYVRDTESGQCVTLNKCPAVNCSNENEVYDMCNGQCQPSCEDQQPICTFVCSAGCVCASGFIRNATGTCVVPEECGNNSTSNSTSFLSKQLQAITKLLDVKFL